MRVGFLALLSGLRLQHCGGIGRRCSLDLALLWPWHRHEAAALIGPLAQDLPCATGVGGEKKKSKKMIGCQGTVKEHAGVLGAEAL